MTVHGPAEPSPWVLRHAGAVPRGTPVLDVACGRGRHVLVFLHRGHPVTAVDVDVSVVAAVDHPELEVVQADLENAPWPEALDARRFGGVVVTNYLWRPLLPRIVRAVAPGGVLIYESFAVGNERHGRPRDPDHLLREGELREAVAGELQVLAYEHGEIGDPPSAVVQRICARREPRAGYSA